MILGEKLACGELAVGLRRPAGCPHGLLQSSPPSCAGGSSDGCSIDTLRLQLLAQTVSVRCGEAPHWQVLNIHAHCL